MTNEMLAAPTTPAGVIVFLAFYFTVAFGLFLYGMHAYLMAGLYRRARRRDPQGRPNGGGASGEAGRPGREARGASRETGRPSPDGDLPRVTVQLPIYNERYVIERLLDAAVALDYPRDRLQIQVLDDSTDETVGRVAELVAPRREQGWDIVHRHRTDRAGFKGGALREGLGEASGELVAIFDADFVPPPTFLRDTVPWFEDPDLGLVQTRWSHLNEDYSILTRTQAAALDGHFLIEHTVRNRHGAFINFNGTAGIWRKQAILDAGNWQDDTLTEDLDLSYRAQLAGWRFLFLPDVTCPAELPAEINGLKGQQHRWAKGSVQTARKVLPRTLRAPLPFFTRFQAFVHLTSHAAYPLLIVIGLCSLPALMVLDRYPAVSAAFTAASFFAVASFGHPWLYFSARRARGGSWREAFAVLPLVVAGNMGIAINNTRALAEALAGRASPFVRTPKYALLSRADRWQEKTYRVPATAWSLAELALAGYALIAAGYAVVHGHFLAVPFLMLYVLGCGYMGWLSLYNAWAGSREARRRVERGAIKGLGLAGSDSHS